MSAAFSAGFEEAKPMLLVQTGTAVTELPVQLLTSGLDHHGLSHTILQSQQTASLSCSEHVNR
jgi:hypothetical protein